MKQRFDHWNRLLTLLRYAGDTLKAQRYLIALGLLALLAETGFKLLEPWPLQYLVDEILLSQASTASSAHLLAAGIACGSLVLVIALRAATAYGWTMAFAIAGNRILLDIRYKLFAHLQLLSLRFHGNARSGDLLTRLVDDVGMVRDVLVTAAMPLAGSVVLLTAMFAVMAWLNWKLTLIAFLGAPLLLALFSRKSKRIHAAAKQQRKQVSQVASTASESLASIKAVQALGMAGSLAQTFASANNADLSSGVKVKRLSAGMERSVDVVIGIITAATLYVGVLEVFAQHLSVGELLVFLAYLRATAKPMRNWAKFTARISKSAAGADRIIEVLETDPEVTERPDALPVSTSRGRIQFENVGFSYAGSEVLRNVSFIIEPGESVAIVGASGSGKSTLLALMMRLYDPVSGTVRLDGHDLTTLQLESLRNNFAVALQDALLFHGTFRDNLTQGRTIAADQVERVARETRVMQLLEQGGLNLDSQIQERGANLSNGEKQRISLARALLKHSPILVVDEPLTGLDTETAAALDDILVSHARERTFIFVTHDFDQACRADRVMYVRDGCVTDLGACEPQQLHQLNQAAGPDASASERHYA